MPLTSISSCYKTLPSYFADKVTQHVRKRNDSFTRYSDTHDDLRTCSTLPEMDTSSGFRLMTKRSCTPLATVSDNESEDGASPRASTPQRSNKRLSPSPRPQTSDATPRGSKRQSPSPRPQTESLASVWNLLHPRTTQTSPRTAVSLDNVDIWEEDLSDNEGFDQINGVAINPRMTIDLSELRRSRSPVATKRNKLDDFQGKETTQEVPDKPASRIHHAKSPSPRRPSSRLLKGINANLLNANKPKSGIELIRPRMSRPEIPATSKPDRADKTQEKNSFEKLPDNITGSVSNAVPSKTAKALELRRTNTKLIAIRNEKSGTINDVTKNPKSVCENPKSSLAREALIIQELKPRPQDDLPSSKVPNVSTPEKKVKVKFNNYVQVNDGGVNTLSQLRESNDSAQMIKQKYLAIDPFKRSTKTPA